ncbi:hypothetical protein GCM10023331_16280 [Algivirga pacifica]|uniref:Uncharacterized protein n=2 Tax=Algivirga pacifica TaxID=1162670 RepID=A0ABP9D7J4_9BACT
MRLFRVAAIIYRLHIAKVIDLQKSELFRTAYYYYEVIMEEISDRVVINVLKGVKTEVRRGNQLFDEVITKVVYPNKSELISYGAQKISRAVHTTYQIYKEDTSDYVEGLVKDVVQHNDEVKSLKLVPIAGNYVAHRIEIAAHEIVMTVIEEILNDLSSPEKVKKVEEVADQAIETFLRDKGGPSLDLEVTDIVCQVIDLLIKQVNVKQWKLRDPDLPDSAEEV